MTKQTVNDSHNVLQVAGNADITYGLAVNEVKELAILFMKDNFPTLRAEAMAVASENVKNLMEQFEIRIADVFKEIDAKKFSDPDIQSSINDAVIAAAKKGDKCNPEILIDLVLERVNISTNDFVSLVAAEAILIVPKLTNIQISFLSLVTVLRYTKYHSASSLELLEHKASIAMPALEASFGISEANKLHLEYSGCASVIAIWENSAIKIWKDNYQFLSEISEETLKSDIEANFPSLHKLSTAFQNNKIAHVTLTPVGQLIGLVNLTKYMGRFNYENWIN